MHKFDDQFIEQITTDDGSEFKGDFAKALKEDDIEHRVINASSNDSLQMAPINYMCKSG